MRKKRDPEKEDPNVTKYICRIVLSACPSVKLFLRPKLCTSVSLNVRPLCSCAVTHTRTHTHTLTHTHAHTPSHAHTVDQPGTFLSNQYIWVGLRETPAGTERLRWLEDKSKSKLIHGVSSKLVLTVLIATLYCQCACVAFSHFDSSILFNPMLSQIVLPSDLNSFFVSD